MKILASCFDRQTCMTFYFEKLPPYTIEVNGGYKTVWSKKK